MSQGPRMPLEQADALAAELLRAWGLGAAWVVDLDGRSCSGPTVVGSVRRRVSEPGDIELVAPIEPSNADGLCARIEATLDDQGEGLFALGAERGRGMGHAVRGLRPGFGAASLLIRRGPLLVPVQVYRAEPGAMGWTTIMRTGPTAYGMHVLARWKRAVGIPPGDETRPASVGGFLVDASGRPVSMGTEEEVYARLRAPWAPPEAREAVAAAAHARGGRR